MIFGRNNKHKKQEEDIQIQVLPKEEHIHTRSLWETTFGEDSEEFADFYYENTIKENTIWVAKDEEEIVSMAQFNPYQLHLGEVTVPTHYIVGVATLEEYRRRGLMREILEESLEQLSEDKEPFTYLMPAKEEYYTGFEFVSVSYQKKGALLDVSDETNLTFERALESDLEEIALFTQRLLAKKYNVFVQRDKTYYQMLKAQFEAEYGELICVYDGDVLVGHFFYGEYDNIEVMEPVCLEAYKDEFSHVIAKKFKDSEKEIFVTAFDFLNEDDFKNIITKPATMIRILCLEEFVKYLRAVEPIHLVLEIRDSILEKNNGVFNLYADLIGTKLEKTTDEPELVLSIKELAAICFQDNIPKSVLEKGMEDTVNKIKKIIKFTPLFLNEFV